MAWPLWFEIGEAVGARITQTLAAVDPRFTDGEVIERALPLPTTGASAAVGDAGSTTTAAAPSPGSSNGERLLFSASSL
jgi:hypothetical protein